MYRASDAAAAWLQAAANPRFSALRITVMGSAVVLTASIEESEDALSTTTVRRSSTPFRLAALMDSRH